MQSFNRKLYDKLETQLKEIIAEETHLLRQTGRCIQLCRTFLQELKSKVKEVPFKDQREEIHFFKEDFPKFYSQYIYYVKIYSIEANRPAGSDKVQLKYLRSHLDRIKHFFDNNLDFYQYYRTGATHFDEAYYVRGKYDVRLLPDDFALAIDPECCTIQSYKAAKLFANDLLGIYIKTAIEDLERGEEGNSTVSNKHTALQWTGPKVALIELIYGLHGAGVFNNSAADIKQITGYLENIFHIELGNVYNVFQEMRIRKKNRSNFIDLLKDRLIQRMDEADVGY